MARVIAPTLRAIAPVRRGSRARRHRSRSYAHAAQYPSRPEGPATYQAARDSKAPSTGNGSSGEDALPAIFAVVGAVVVAAGYLAARSVIQLVHSWKSGNASGAKLAVGAHE